LHTFFEPCTVLQETIQNSFQFSSVFQLTEERSAFFLVDSVLGPCFALQGAGIESTTSLARNVTLTISITPGIQKCGVFFNFPADTKSKREKKFKTLRQNIAFVHRAALSAPKPANPDRAR
jgi:hypothetical protein